jgi:hypothetical protein
MSQLIEQEMQQLTQCSHTAESPVFNSGHNNLSLYIRVFWILTSYNIIKEGNIIQLLEDI